MTMTIKQHYVQQFCLKQFATRLPGSNIFYLKAHQKDKTFINDIKHLCYEDYFYENEKFNQNYFENEISKIEIQSSNAINRLLREYNKKAERNKRSIYNITSFCAQIKLEKIICIFKHLTLQYIRTKKYKDTYGEKNFFNELKNIINMNQKSIKNSCLYKNYNIYMCINNTDVDLTINDVNLYYLKNKSNNNIIAHNINKKIFLLIIKKNTPLNVTINEEFINQINDCCKTQCYKYYFESPSLQEIINYKNQE